MTIAQLRADALKRLAGRENADQDVLHILAFVLKRDLVWVLAHGNDELSDQEAASALNLIDRRAKHEPLAYLLGFQPFDGRDFFVTPDVLIPRPESELIIERVKEDLSALPEATIVDVGTGSGCLAITAALECRAAHVIAIDISASALEIARRNASNLHANSIEFLAGDLLRPLLERGQKADAIMANLPYLPQDDIDLSPTANELAYEPQQALLAADGGLALIKTCAQQAEQVLKEGGKLYLEMLPDQIPAFSVWLMLSGLPYTTELVQDLTGQDRIVVLTKTC